MRRRDILAAPAVVLASSLRWPRLERAPNRWRASRVNGDLNVRLRRGVLAGDEFAAIMRRHRARIVRFLPISNVAHVRTPMHDGEALAHELEAAGVVEFADPSLRTARAASAIATPDDPLYGSNAGMWTTINAPEVWYSFKMVNYPYATMPPVVMVDGGIQGTFSGGVFTPTHPDLSAAGQVVSGWNATLGNTNVVDTTGGHSTSCCAWAAATTNDNVGVNGAGWGGTILPIVQNSDTDIAAALSWIAANVTPPGFLCHPYTFSVYSATADAAIQGAWRAGFMNFGAAGDLNSSTCQHGPCDSPAPTCIGITAVDGIGSTPLSRAGVRLGSGVNYGPSAQPGGVGAIIAAPGGSGEPLWIAVLGSTWSDGGTLGTSWAAPIVCAVARFLKVVQPGLTNQSIFDIITDPSNGIGGLTNFAATPSLKCIDFLACVNAAFAFNPTTMQ